MDLINTLNWIIVLINILGVKWVVENNQHSAKRANKLWSITNPLIILYNLYIQSYSLAFMFTIYWIYVISGALGKADPFITIIKFISRR